MKISTSLMLSACLALGLAACNRDEAPQETVSAPLTAPAGTDRAEWTAYVQDVVGRNMGGLNTNPYVYFLPAEGAEDYDGQYERLAEKVEMDVARGIVSGNMLAYASPGSARMADMVVAAFANVPPNTMKGVRVLFIGDAADNARVQAAVAPAGVDYVFVEAA